MTTGARGADVYLLPGQLCIEQRPVAIRTVLGSCVAVCLWDPIVRVGGVNHYLLAEAPDAASDDLRYGASAMERLLRDYVRAGASLARTAATVIGGARPVRLAAGDRIGAENVAVALAALAAHDVPVARRDTGGERGRRVIFDLRDGAVDIALLSCAGRAAEDA